MIEIRILALCAALALTLSACGKEGTEDVAEETAPVAAKAPAVLEPPPSPMPEKNIPVEVAADAITVGTSLQGDTVLKSASTQFTTGDTVYASALVRGKPAGADVVAFWTYQDGTTHKMETRKLASGGQQTVWFSFAKADGMKPGKYNVEIDVNMTPVGIVDFQIK